MDIDVLRVADVDTDGDLETDSTRFCVRDIDGELLAIRVLEIDPELLAMRVRDIEGELLAIRVNDTDTDTERDTDTVAGRDADDDRLDPNDVETDGDGILDIVGDAETLLD